jgi:hypothetical protein
LFPNRILLISCHQLEALLLPLSTWPSLNQYLAARTLNNRLSGSCNNLQHHLLRREILNSFTLGAPRPPCSLLRQILSHLIQFIFLDSSLPPP